MGILTPSWVRMSLSGAGSGSAASALMRWRIATPAFVDAVPFAPTMRVGELRPKNSVEGAANELHARPADDAGVKGAVQRDGRRLGMSQVITISAVAGPGAERAISRVIFRKSTDDSAGEAAGSLAV
jgi:hypothetical protein